MLRINVIDAVATSQESGWLAITERHLPIFEPEFAQVVYFDHLKTKGTSSQVSVTFLLLTKAMLSTKRHKTEHKRRPEHNRNSNVMGSFCLQVPGSPMPGN